jgi:hypothetical protein
MFAKQLKDRNHSSDTCIQPQLEIGEVDDEYEKEANDVADKVMRMPESDQIPKMTTSIENIQMKIDEDPNKMGDSNEGKIQMMVDNPVQIQKMSDGNNGGLAVPQKVEQKINSSNGSGQPLPANTQADLGVKMNTDLSNVKVHNDSNSVQMNKEIGAKAFTHGNDIYFNQGQYNPQSSQGKHLLAHELAHTVQQRKSSNIIARSEVDGNATGKLQDSESKIDEYVNKTLNDVRSKYTDLSSYEKRSDFVKDVYGRIGRMSSLFTYQSEIEVWVEKELEKGVYWTTPYSMETKYANVKENFGFWSNFKVLGPTMLVAGTGIGSDKLGHFFHEGFEYFKDIKKITDSDKKYDPDQRSTWAGWDKMKDHFYSEELGIQGANTTGVYSFADLAANYAGYSFYIDLLINPNMNFSIRSYMGEHITPDNDNMSKEQYNSDNKRSHWSEETNSNMYRRDLSRYVWKNVLMQNNWSANNDTGSVDISFKPDYSLDSVNVKLNHTDSDKQSSTEFSQKKVPVTLKGGNPFGRINEKDRSKVNSNSDLIEGVSISGKLDSKSGETLQITIDSLSEQKLELKFLNESQKEQVWVLERTPKG